MKLLLLDSNSLINRAFYALPGLRDTKGRYTGGLFGFTSMLSKLIKSEKPTHIAAAFDVHAPTFRHLKYADYKAGRRPMPEELRPQIPAMKELLSAMGIKVVELSGFEADDLIGTLATKSPMETVIVSGDKDVLQLVSDKVTVLHTRKGITDVVRYTPSVLKEESLTPGAIVELKSLMGDHSDNIPGVPGVGEKTAKDLIVKYGTLENVYLNINEIKGKLKDKLIEGRESAEFSRYLATIEVNAPIEAGDFSEFSFSPVLPFAAKRLMMDYEFKSLTDRFTFSEPTEQIEKKDIKISEISEVSELDRLLSEGETAPEFCLYIQGQDIRFALSESEEYRLVISENILGEGLSEDAAVDKICGFIRAFQGKIFVYDLKRTYSALAISPENTFAADDVMLMAYIADCGKSYSGAEDLLSSHGFEGKCIAAELLALKNSLIKTMISSDSIKVYEEIELPLVPVLFDMEKHGFRVNRSVLDELTERYSSELKKISEAVYAVVGHEFNINSPKQLAEVLFDELKLPSGKKRSTSADVLSEIESDSPVVDLVLRYRTLSKLISTYLIGMKSLVDRDGYIHTVFNQATTSTGRLSSSEPNLQNIPVREEEGREIRGAFIPGDGNVLVSADYSQIELRLMAHFSGDEGMINSFLSGVDIHKATAARVFGVREEDVTSKMRRDAKAVNFGIIYGISDFGLAKNINSSVKEARAFIEKYLDTYPKVREYMKSSVEFAKEHGFVVTYMGRVRALPDIKSSNYALRAFAERAALNMPLQGTAADIIKLAMIKVYRRLKAENLKAELILQIHDELIVDSPREEEERVRAILKEEMEGVVSLSVPLTVNAASGATWKEAK